MDLEKALEELGLNGKESKIYLANLELGQATIQEIGRKAGIRRTTVYPLIDDLKGRGLISSFRRGSKTYFLAEDPQHLATLLVEKQKVLEVVLPQLRSLHNSSATKPKIKFYEGREGIKQVYQDTLDEGKEILTFTPWKSMANSMPDYWPIYVGERVKKQIHVRVLADRSKESEYYKEMGPRQLRELRFLSEGTPPFDTEINIYGNKIAMLTFGKEFIGVIIESEVITRTFRMLFETVWKSQE